MEPSAGQVVAFIDGRLDEMLSRPRAWASTPESLEFQVLGLLEVRGILRGGAPIGPRDDTWRARFVLLQDGEGYLSDRFRDAEVDDALFLEALRPAVRGVRTSQDGA
jgi:hypothetical protein